MRSFFEWFQDHVRTDDTWLMLGKGPSFALRERVDLSGYRTLSLNHAAREQPVLVAHVIDLDVIDACGEAIERNAQVLLMPWFPHIRNLVGSRSLEEIAGAHPVLRRLTEAGRLLWYDLSTSPVRHGGGPVVEATYFSAEAALNLLALAGVRRVRSLGVDGGSEYSGAFEDLRDLTLLANGQSSFDLQFEGFARTILSTGIDFAPLDRPAPVSIYSMYRPSEALPLVVLEHSIRRRASLSIEFLPLTELDVGAVRQHPALVFPSQALVRGDVRRLWPASFPDRELLIASEGGSGAHMALVGAGLSQALPEIASVIQRSGQVAELNLSVAPAEWNLGSSISKGSSLLVRFPDDGSQPWLSRKHPLAHVWIGELLSAVRHGSVSPSRVADEIRRGHARPSLLYQVEHGILEPSLIPRRARQLDRDFYLRRAERPDGPAWPTVVGAIHRELVRRMSEVRRTARALYHSRGLGRVLSGRPSS